MQRAEILQKIAQMPASQIWRLAIERKYKYNSSTEVETYQPGAIRAGLQGLFAALQHLDQNLSIPLIEAIQLASLTVSENAGYRSDTIPTHLPRDCVSEAGLTEFLKRNPVGAKIRYTFEGSEGASEPTLLQYIKNQPSKLEYHFSNENILTLNTLKSVRDFPRVLKKGYVALEYMPPKAEMITAVMLSILETYNTQMAVRRDDDLKLALIANTILQLMQLRPFKSAAHRTFVTCLLNQMLMSNLNEFAIIDDATLLEFHAVDELVAAIKNGIAAAHEVMGNLTPTLSNSQALSAGSEFLGRIRTHFNLQTVTPSAFVQYVSGGRLLWNPVSGIATQAQENDEEKTHIVAFR